MVALVFALSVRSYFSTEEGSSGNKVSLATLDLEVSEEDGSVLAPFDFGNIYPGWDHEMRGKISSLNSSEMIFRIMVKNGSFDFTSLANVILYELKIENDLAVPIYSKNGYLKDLNEDNNFMNIVIGPEDSFVYSLNLKVPSDIDDCTTPENEDDNQYQGKSAQFDFMIQSTQTENSFWQGF
jgi:hypothetical protein